MQDLLRVRPNPFGDLDHLGQPAGTYPYDPKHANGARRWVGARIDTSPDADGQPKTRRIDRGSRADFTLRANVGGVVRAVKITAPAGQRTVFAFDMGEHTIPASEHFVRGVREGSLIPTDAATAKRCGVAFVDPEKALQRAAEKAIADWQASYRELPDFASWPPELLAAAGLAETATATAKDDEQVAPAPGATSEPSPVPLPAVSPLALAASNAPGGDA